MEISPVSDPIGAASAFQPFEASRRALSSRLKFKYSTFIHLSFLLFIFSIPFESIGDQPGEAGTFSISKAFGYLFVIIAMTRPHLSLGRWPKPGIGFLLYFCVFLAEGLIYNFSSPHDFLSRLLQIMQMIILFWMSYNLLQDRKLFTYSLWTIVLSSFCLAILQLSGVTASNYHDQIGRSSALGEDPNNIASVWVIASSTLAGLLMTDQLKKKKWYINFFLPVFPVFFLVIIRTGSRGAIVSLAVGAAAVFLFSSRHLKPLHIIRTIFFVGMLTVMLGWFLFSSQTAITRWMSTVQGGDTSGREDIFHYSWQMFLDQPIFGYGPVRNFDILGQYTHGSATDTHNLFLLILTEVGLVGALPYLWAIAESMRSAWKGRKAFMNGLPLILLLVDLTINSSLDWQLRKFHWLILAMAAAAGRLHLATKREISESTIMKLQA